MFTWVSVTKESHLYIYSEVQNRQNYLLTTSHAVDSQMLQLMSNVFRTSKAVPIYLWDLFSFIDISLT